MCRACGDPTHQPSRRQFLKGSALAATSPLLFGGGQAQAQSGPRNNVPGETGRRILLRGGHVMSMDPTVGNFETGDVLIEGRRIVDVGASIDAGDAEVVDATGRVVMPGFIDTHHHQFETALRGWLADGIMYDDGTEAGSPNYLDDILGRFAMAYRPEDVYVSELFGGLSQLMRASRPFMTSPRSTIRRNIPTRPSRRCSMPGVARCSAISRATARRRAIQRTPRAFANNSSRPTISS